MSRVRVAVPAVDRGILLRLVEEEERARAAAADRRLRLARVLRKLADEGYSVRALADAIGSSSAHVHRLIRTTDE